MHIINNSGNRPQDYMRNLFIISLLENNQKVYNNFNIDYIFDNYDKNTKLLYGRGITFTKCLDKNFKNNTNIVFTAESNLKRLNINKYNIPNSCFI